MFLLHHREEIGKKSPNINFLFILTYRSGDITTCILSVIVGDHGLSTFLKYRHHKNRSIWSAFVGSQPENRLLWKQFSAQYCFSILGWSLNAISLTF